MKILIVANNCKWKSWDKKIEQLKEWFAPKVQLEVTLKHTSFKDMMWSVYYSEDPRQGGAGFEGLDPDWYNANVTPLAYGYDIVLFVLDRKEWKSVKARGWRTDYDQGPVELHLGAGENEKMQWPHFPPMSAFFQLARHEILHACYKITGQYDMTHYWWDRGQIDYARDTLVFPKDYRTPGLMRTLNWLTSMRDRVLDAKNTVPPVPEPPLVPEEKPRVVSNREKLYAEAKKCLGKNMTSPGVPTDYGCMSSINNVFKQAFGTEIGGGASTVEGLKALNRDKRFLEVTKPLPGDIVMHATGTSTKGFPNGHVGVWGETHVMSNNSNTGKWDAHYTHEAWLKRFYKEKGFPPRYFNVK